MTGYVLVVDDDVMVRDVVGRYLGRAGYHVTVVLDLMLPGLPGLEVCRRLRAAGPVPVVMLTALGEEEDRILRVVSVLRRARSPQPVNQLPPVTDDGLIVDSAGRRAVLDGQELGLTVREFDLLAFLIRRPGQAFSRSELLEQV